ncbi:MAG TPA: hypothetical protein VFR46_01690 [Actinomycetes bacterium]|nr:hypothetical protein [Actinomycetes bacterium]
MVSNIAASSNRPLIFPAAAGGVARHVQLIGVRGWAVVGFLAVLVEHLDQLHTPGAQLGRGVQRGLRGQLLFDRSPLLRGQPLRGPRLRHAGDRVDVAQTRLARGEHPGSVRQPRGQQRAIQGAARRDVVGGGGALAGFEPLPPHQIHQRRRHGLVALAGEEPTPRQGGDRVDGDSVLAACRALAHRDHRQQVTLRTRLHDTRERLRRLGEQAVRALERGLGHGVILARRTDSSGPSRARFATRTRVRIL